MMPFSLRNLLIFFALVSLTGHAVADHIKFHKTTDAPRVSPKKKSDKEVLRYNKRLLSAYDKYKKKAAKIWGDENLTPSPDKDVTYRDNFKQRSVVDYAQGIVNIELALSGRKAKNAQAINRSLKTAIRKTLLQGPDERSIISIAKNPTPPEGNKSPVLEGLVTLQDGSPITADNAAAFSRQQAQITSKRTLVGYDGKKRVVVSTRFHLLPNHIRIRANKFSEAVEHYAELHEVPSPLIYAIIETESMFNPYAKSPAPAFGLMQLMPGGGARDAFKFLYSKDRIVKERYLYDPDNNIELGVVYLHMLYFRYFRHIKDPDARTWASVAAYNTGAQNVIKAFSGKYSKANYATRLSWKRHALTQINSMDPENVYNHLQQFLPYEETRNYIRKVRDRMKKYKT